MTDLRGRSFRRLSSSAVFSSPLQKVAFEKILIIISAAGHALFRPREDLRRVGEKFVGGLALTIIRASARPLADLLPASQASVIQGLMQFPRVKKTLVPRR